MSLSKNKSFSCFKDFRKELKLFSKLTRQKFVTAKSQLNKNKSIESSSHPYKMKLYKCEKHKSEKCLAAFRLCLKSVGQNKNKYVITRSNLDHSHNLRSTLNSSVDTSASSSSSSSSSSCTSSLSASLTSRNEAEYFSCLTDNDLNFTTFQFDTSLDNYISNSENMNLNQQEINNNLEFF